MYCGVINSLCGCRIWIVRFYLNSNDDVCGDEGSRWIRKFRGFWDCKSYWLISL